VRQICVTIHCLAPFTPFVGIATFVRLGRWIYCRMTRRPFYFPHVPLCPHRE
jgi:hypothetical protein